MDIKYYLQIPIPKHLSKTKTYMCNQLIVRGWIKQTDYPWGAHIIIVEPEGAIYPGDPEHNFSALRDWIEVPDDFGKANISSEYQAYDSEYWDSLLTQFGLSWEILRHREEGYDD